MEAVSHHIEYISQDFHVIASVESIGNLVIFVDIQQHFLKKIKAQVTVSAEFMPERPDDAI